MEERNIDLRAAIPDTPDLCREAVLHAVSTYQEVRYMRKSYRMILATALAIMLLCGTAYAIVNYYSVRDYVANGQTSAEFEENIVPLEKTVTTNGLSFTLGDAVFDGADLAFTMNVAAAEDAQPLYIYPKLQAFCGDKELDVDYQGTSMSSDLGWFVPNPDYPEAGVGDHGADASLNRSEVAGDVTWRYTLQIMKPTGELVYARDWADQTETYEQWEDYLRGLLAEGKIGYNYGCSIMDWLNAVSSSDRDETFVERMLGTGLFELADTVTFEFTTRLPGKALLASEQVFTCDDFTLTVTSLSQSFLQVNYELEVVFNEEQAHEHYVEQWYDLFDQNGVELKNRGRTLSLAEDKLHCTVWGSAERISDEPLTAITFVLDPMEWPEGKEIPTFTLEIEQ